VYVVNNDKIAIVTSPARIGKVGTTQHSRTCGVSMALRLGLGHLVQALLEMESVEKIPSLLDSAMDFPG